MRNRRGRIRWGLGWMAEEELACGVENVGTPKRRDTRSRVKEAPPPLISRRKLCLGMHITRLKVPCCLLREPENCLCTGESENTGKLMECWKVPKQDLPYEYMCRHMWLLSLLVVFSPSLYAYILMRTCLRYHARHNTVSGRGPQTQDTQSPVGKMSLASTAKSHVWWNAT